MSRRLLGPIGGPLAFFLVAALVFGGLGWVTYAALGVEQAQRESAARAELGANLRVALWRLDGRMLPTLGVEDSRPYYQYGTADPNTAYGAAATPLLAATLPDWMKLHFQLDPTDGWASPQVLDAAIAERIRQAWPELPLRNLDSERERTLAGVKVNFSTQMACASFAARDLATQDEPLALTSPLLTGIVTPPALAESTPVPAPPTTATPMPAPPGDAKTRLPGPVGDSPNDSILVLGYELCLRCESPGIGNNPNTQLGQKKSNEPDLPGGNARFVGPAQGNQVVTNRGGRMSQKDNENDRAWVEWSKRAEMTDKAIKEARQAGDYQFPRGQFNPNYQNVFPGNSLDQKNLGNNSIPNGFSQSGSKNDGNTLVLSLTPLGAVVGCAGISSATTRPLGSGRDGFSRDTDKDNKGQSPKDQAPAKQLREAELRALGVVAGVQLPDGKVQLDGRATEKGVRDSLKQLDDTLRTSGLFGEWVHETLRRKLLFDDKSKAQQQLPGEKQAVVDPMVQPPSPAPAEDRPVAPAGSVGPTQPIAIHLGSLRPQWMTGADGSETLVLVRTAKFDNKTVYQGVILDWAKLEAALKEEVKDLFPDAQLVPVKDTTTVLPDRAMTALPIQLDPGPEQALGRAGWTPLRIGLVLAWAAAIIAFAAVGFSGWSLIDLAERRFKFVSAVTHELRTPLTSLRLYLDLLVSGMIQDEAKRQDYLRTLAVESDRLHRLIDNVLDYAKLEKRRKNGDIKPVKVTDLLGQLRQTWTDRVAQDGKELVVISTLPSAQEVSTDAGMIQQIVGNLIDNAKKYSRDAADHRIWVWAKPGIGKSVVIEVEDRGPGVPAGERRTIFKPFRRGEQADTRAGGAGLGLALARSWAEVLGGRLTYRPAEGGTGSCFRLELPEK